MTRELVFEAVSRVVLRLVLRVEVGSFFPVEVLAFAIDRRLVGGWLAGLAVDLRSLHRQCISIACLR